MTEITTSMLTRAMMSPRVERDDTKKTGTSAHTVEHASDHAMATLIAQVRDSDKEVVMQPKMQVIRQQIHEERYMMDIDSMLGSMMLDQFMQDDADV